MARIKDPNMTLKDMIILMADANPGGLSVLMMILKEGGAVDPDIGDGFMTVLHLDTLEIYGTKIWVLFKESCGQNIAKTVAVVRCWQMGLLTREQIHACLGDGEGVRGKPIPELPAALEALAQQLPAFRMDLVNK